VTLTTVRRSTTTRTAAMKAIGATILAVLAAQALGAIAFIYSGVFNVAATDPHWDLTYAIRGHPSALD